MAYIDPLDPTTPADSDFAGQGDDKIREFKRAILQRLGSFFANTDADPLVPKNASVPGAAIVGESITAAQIAANAVGTAEIADGAVTAAKLAGGAATPPDNSITNAMLQDNAVTAGKLAADSVTSDKIGTGAVGADEIADGSVGRAEIAATTKDHLVYVQTGTFEFPAGSNIPSPGNLRARINLDTNGQVSPVAVVILNPEVVSSDVNGDLEWTNLLGITGVIQVVAGDPNPRLVITVHNYGTAADLSGRKIHWMVVQVYSSGLATWP